MTAEHAAQGSVAPRVAFWTLGLFCAAVLAALGITLGSVARSVKWFAGAVVVPIVALTLILLYFERRGRRWSFVGAAGLGVLGVALRLLVNTVPADEVGGGLPAEVTVAYVGLGVAVAATSLWSILTFERGPTAS